MSTYRRLALVIAMALVVVALGARMHRRTLAELLVGSGAVLALVALRGGRS